MRLRIEDFGRDLHYAARSLSRSRAFATTIILTLALGIGVNSAVFSLVYAAFLRPLPFPQSQRLAFVSTGESQSGIFNAGVSGRELEEWKPQLQRIFEEFATVSRNRDTTWTTVSGGAHLRNRDVSGNFFQLLGVHPLAGRTITTEDTVQGHGDVVLLSYDFWRRQFGGDRHALGQPMRKRGEPFSHIPWLAYYHRVLSLMKPPTCGRPSNRYPGS